ncbi:enoyl-CoA hydratase-related protein [Lentibacillus sp. CBA3610]|uniref:enoyl-CoA hydratase-related protein n=1 Tax=Lentibacillus sp. CBA3610 TaxID=2518176 RepID=UPI001595950F|nr:enoyl-CoA hydratase-related protein [Lentibacillus sp. CBA3610]QKY70274.1 hypothetical protein Len3610_12310 [Lentibacillus sp. CBA3610]
MNYEQLLTKLDDGVLTITLNRPKVLNALSTQLKKKLAHVFENANTNREVKSIVITGAGDRAFCSGQDLGESKNVMKRLLKNG